MLQLLQRLLLLRSLCGSLVGLVGATHLQDDNRLDRFVPPRPDYDEAEQLRRQKIEATFYCFLTTAIGFGSLATSPIPAIRDLGLLAGGGIFLAGLTVLIVLPWLLDRWVPRGDLVVETKNQTSISMLWGWLGILTVVVSCYLYPCLRTEMRATQYFEESHPVQRSRRRLEQDFLPVRSYEVLIDREPQALASADLGTALSVVPGIERVLDRDLPGFPAFAEEGHLRRTTVFVSDAALADETQLENDIRASVRRAVGESTQVDLVGIQARIVSAQQAIYATFCGAVSLSPA